MPASVEIDDDFNVTMPKSFYFGADPKSCPSAVRPGKGVGSEGPVANLIRDLCTVNGASQWLDHPSIHQMRSTRTKVIILVDDIIGSGSRIRTFLQGFFSHKTIRSWHSYGCFKTIVVSFAAHVEAVNRLSKSRLISQIRSEVSIRRGSPEWSSSDRKAIEALCIKYAEFSGKRGIPFGYKDVFTCLAFDYKCPNTAPAIIWAGSNEWRALFATRPRLHEQEWPKDFGIQLRAAKTLAAHGHQGISDGIGYADLSEHERLAMYALAFCANAPATTGLSKADRPSRSVSNACGKQIPLLPVLRKFTHGDSGHCPGSSHRESPELGANMLFIAARHHLVSGIT